MSACRLMILVVLVALTAACQKNEQAAAAPVLPGDATRGQTLTAQYGCGGCHEIPGVPSGGVMGPSLAGIANRPRLAGGLVNEPANMVRWISDPKSVNPATFMPDVNMSEQDASDIAAYLYTLK